MIYRSKKTRLATLTLLAGSYFGLARPVNVSSFRALGVLPGDTFSSAAAVNDRGEVVGQSGGVAGVHPFL